MSNIGKDNPNQYFTVKTGDLNNFIEGNVISTYLALYEKVIAP